MNRIDRLFGILTLLQSSKYVTAEKIADRFEISVRTVYRDVKALGESGVPVSFEPAKGYFIVQGFFLPPVSFNIEETGALLFMESLAHGFSDRSIQQHYATALNKIKAVLRTADKEKLENLTRHIRLQMPPCLKNDYEYLSFIQQAITAKAILEISYTNNNNETSLRKVEPIGLLFYALNWHLIAWCHLRNDYRDFRVSRIVQLRVREEPFQKPDHIALSDYMEQIPVAY